VAICLTCHTEFHGGEQFCPRDGTPLQVAPAGDRLSGRVLSGRYRLLSRLGQGGMGAVYRAHHILMDKPVAVKVLRHELSSDAEAVARFHREARSASRLDHEHIIRVTDFGQSDDALLFLVMELLDGESLAELLHREAPLPWRRAVAITREVLSGLSHAHEQGIVHRDLKPENIVLARRGKSSRPVVKVLDFGLAKLVHEAPGLSEHMSLTRTGVVFGTPEYMSPEQAEGGAIDPRTDLYALGVILYQMVTGEVPFSAPTVLALIAKTVQDPPEPPSARMRGGELPPALEALILRCLEKSPAQRPQNAEEVIEALDEICAAHPDPQAGDTPSRSASASASGRMPATPAPSPAGGVRQRPDPSRPDSGPGQVAFAPTLMSQVTPQGVAAMPTAEAAAKGPVTAPVAASPSWGTSSQMAVGEAGGADDAGDAGEELVPARPPGRPRRWAFAAAAGLVLAGAGALALGPRLKGGLSGESTVGPDQARPSESASTRDPIAAAAELLDARRADEALALLQAERARGNSPALQRLLSRAHEERTERLRALGHMYAAVTLAGPSGEEAQRSQISLAQLLGRMGHTQESCRLAKALLQADPAQVLRSQAEALARTQCGPRP
jgi:serine/threonine-protein kinase